jgi:COMPASS component SWD3
MSELQHYYKILGLSVGASQADVKHAYRELAKVWHPDRFTHDPQGKQQAEAQFKQINEAYNYLRDYQFDPSDEPEPPLEESPPPEPTTTRSTVTTHRTDPELFYQRGAELVKAGRYTESLEEFTTAIRLDPSYAQAYRYRGFVNSMLGFELGAEADLEKARILELEKTIRKPPSTPSQNSRSPHSTTPSASAKQPAQNKSAQNKSAQNKSAQKQPLPKPPAKQQWQCLETLTGTVGITAIAVNANGKLLVSANQDGTVVLWNLRTGKPFFTLAKHTEPVLAVSLSGDGKVLATGGADRAICLWDVQAGTLLHTFFWHSAKVSCVALSCDRQFLASGSLDSTVCLWKLGSRKPQVLSEARSPVQAVALSHDNQTLLSGDTSGTIRLYHGRTGELLRTIQGNGAVSSLAIGSNALSFATGHENGQIQLWEDRALVTGQPLTTLNGHQSTVRSLTFSPDHSTLASASDDHTIQLWHVASQSHLATLANHKAEVTAALFSADGKTIISASRDRTIKIWQRQ